MLNVKEYMNCFINHLKEVFRDRLLYVGLQGSYMRGEATEDSDIDVVVILDELHVADLIQYRKIVKTTKYPDKSCGFICGKRDMVNWNPMEICHLEHSTEDYYGTLSNFIPKYTEQDVVHFIKLSLNNLYHEICHRYLHSDTGKNKQKIVGSYKGVFFIMQNIYFLKSGVFVKTKKELLLHLAGIDEQIMKMALELEKNGDYDFDVAFELLFKWCQTHIREVW